MAYKQLLTRQNPLKLTQSKFSVLYVTIGDHFFNIIAQSLAIIVAKEVDKKKSVSKKLRIW